MKSEVHKTLQKVAIKWLYNMKCDVFAEEVPTKNGIADALGVNTKKNNSYYVEAKVSRVDLICKKQRRIYRNSWTLNNEIDFYYFIIPDNVKFEKDLYTGWGIINENGKVIRRAKRMFRVDTNNNYLIRNIAHLLVYKVFGKLYD